MIEFGWASFVERRAFNYRMFAIGWCDPVESATYAGYMGA